MATYATLTVPVVDIIGADFNASRASVWIEPNVPFVLADSIRVGGRREQVVNGVATFANLVTTDTADNPTSFGYRVTITAPPKGAAARKDIVNLTTADFPFTATADLTDISEAWDNVVLPVEWRSAFRDEMEALEAATEAHRAAVENVVITDLGTTDGQTKTLIETDGTLTKSAVGAAVSEGSGRYVPTAAAADGTTDDTAAIQAVIDALPAGGLIDGGGKTYAVTSLQLKSDMVMENFNLLTLPGPTGFRSPITIGITANAAPSTNVDTTLWQNITLRRVHVNGQRAQQTGNLYISEDGGLHGFRILGRVENLLMEDCSATMCATDGIEIYSGFGVEAFKSYSDGIKRNLRFVRCDFTWNRRHGASLDAAVDVWFEDCRFNDNGQIVAGGTTGADGARSPNNLGSLYGNGMDMEEYGLKTYTGDIHYIRCEALRNVRTGILGYVPVDANDPNFVTRDGFYFEKCRLDKGTDGTAGQYGLSMTPLATDELKGPYFSNVDILNCDLDGGFFVRSGTGIRHRGGTVTNGPGGNVYVGGLINATALSTAVDRQGRSYSLALGATVAYAETAEATRVAGTFAANELWVPAKNFMAVTSATETTVNGVHGISLADAATSRITAMVNLPSTWATMDAYLVWTMATGSLGNARVLYYGTELPAGATIPASQASPDVVLGAAGGANVVVSTKFPAAKTVTANRTILIGIRRDGSHVDDTLADGAVVLGLRLVKKT